MDKISSLNYIKSNSESYVTNLANQNAAINDIFYFAALNSRENQGSFFYLNENGFTSKESLVFDNQKSLMQDVAINSVIDGGGNTTFINSFSGVKGVTTTQVDGSIQDTNLATLNGQNGINNRSDRNTQNNQIFQLKVPVKFTYPSQTSTTRTNTTTTTPVIRSSVQYVYPNIR